MGEVSLQTVLKYYHMPLEEKEQSREKRKKMEKPKVNFWGIIVLLRLVFGAAIIFLGFIWGTILMIVDIFIAITILKNTPDNFHLDRGVKVNIIIGTLVSTAILIIIYIYFQIFWYFG